MKILARASVILAVAASAGPGAAASTTAPRAAAAATTPTEAAATVLPPALGRSVDVVPVSGVVYVKPPPGQTLGPSGDLVAGQALAKGRGFVQLTRARRIPTGSQVDARAGTLRITAAAATTNGKLETGTFTGAIFGLAQDRSGLNKGLTTLSIVENAFPGAPSFASCKTAAAWDGSPAASAAVSSKVLQALLASARGHFRTKGRFSAATVRGTEWGERDRCDGSLTVVRRGTVTVRDFVRHVTVTVTAGHTYLARALAGGY
jgi:hypothetical protein